MPENLRHCFAEFDKVRRLVLGLVPCMDVHAGLGAQQTRTQRTFVFHSYNVILFLFTHVCHHNCGIDAKESAVLWHAGTGPSLRTGKQSRTSRSPS